MSLASRALLGMLTPSSNTVLEPMIARILADQPQVSAHFSRFRVTQIALSTHALAQFQRSEILRAAELLDDARCQTIAWNGTAAGWLGFDADVQLCREIEARTKARACTSVLALNEILAVTGAKRIALVSPYTPDVQQAIIANYAAIGIDVVAEVHWNLSDNYSFGEVDESTIANGIRQVAHAKPDAIAIYCTNLRGAALAAPLEAECGVPIYDTVSTAVWKSLLLSGQELTKIRGWGRIFDVTAG